MFAMIAYTNYRKGVGIKVHGYASTEEAAVQYAKEALVSENKGFEAVPNSDEYEI